jgi:hypothetical protein
LKIPFQKLDLHLVMLRRVIGLGSADRDNVEKPQMPLLEKSHKARLGHHMFHVILISQHQLNWLVLVFAERH